VIQIGKRVQIHPATDAWMQGDRYGVVVKHTRNRKASATGYRTHHVKMDKSGRTLKLSPELVTEI